MFYLSAAVLAVASSAAASFSSIMVGFMAACACFVARLALSWLVAFTFFVFRAIAAVTCTVVALLAAFAGVVAAAPFTTVARAILRETAM